MDNTIFAKRLKEARTAAGLTQGELSKVAGVTAATISAYESADGTKGKNPSLDNALKLAQALHISLDWLCGSIVTNEKFQTTDFLKMFIKLSDFCGIAVEKIDLADIKNRKQFSEITKVIFADSEQWSIFIQEEDEAKHYGTEFHWEVPILYLDEYLITSFLSEWKKMFSLYNSGTINENLYNLWINQQFQSIDEKQKEREEKQKEIKEYYAKIAMAENKGGEPDGND